MIRIGFLVFVQLFKIINEVVYPLSSEELCNRLAKSGEQYLFGYLTLRMT